MGSATANPKLNCIIRPKISIREAYVFKEEGKKERKKERKIRKA